MDTTSTNSSVVCKNSEGTEMHATLGRLSRHQVVLEIYDPQMVLQMSEVLNEVKITINGEQVYSGRAIICSIVNTGTTMVCEATLEDSWLDVSGISTEGWITGLREDYSRFITASQKTFKILPEFKIAVSDLQMLLMDLRTWLDKIELELRTQSVHDQVEMERRTILELQEPIVATVMQVLEKFELAASKVEPRNLAAHMSYMKRHIHPLVLCAPFIYRTFFKPLGYAGDYEMVRMMSRDPYEGGSIFAKILNRIFLSTPPVQAHRDRLTYLTQMLEDETARALRTGQTCRIFNLGCGPAKEIQDFIAEHHVSRAADFTLLDFNDETLAYTSKTLADLVTLHGRGTKIHTIKKSVNQVIKDATKRVDAGRYNFVYCAGLFDYLNDSVCKRLLNIFYEMVAPGGLLVATNVDASNPSKGWMEYVLDWHLVYRTGQQFATLAPDAADPDSTVVRSVGTGVNIFLEVRKPENG